VHERNRMTWLEIAIKRSNGGVIDATR